MNFVSVVAGLKWRVKKSFQLAYFLFIQKPSYCLSFNGNGNKFSCDGRLFNSSVLITGRNNSLIVKAGCQLYNTNITISGEGNVVILENSVVFSEGGRIRVEDNRNMLHIGDHTNIINCFFSISDDDSKVEVGRNCLFSANVIVRNSDSHSILNEEGKRFNYSKDVVVGDHVWVSYGATLLKGSCVASDSIVGTNALLANFQGEPNSLIVGSPAKCVKTGITWDVNRIPKQY